MPWEVASRKRDVCDVAAERKMGSWSTDVDATVVDRSKGLDVHEYVYIPLMNSTINEQYGRISKCTWCNTVGNICIRTRYKSPLFNLGAVTR